MENINTTNALRARFLQFFQTHHHTLVPSSSLVPINDSSLLFTNAGMVQFKQLFLGERTADYTRAVSSQRCVRAGGKHNDLDNVGYTARHHTFFEMLGNFSFGDYVKEQAIIYAWDFLTKELGLAQEKLWITVFREDDEAADIWINTIGIDPKRLSRCDEADNFWSMGETGPCGPCSEIFYDHGDTVAGGPPGSPEQDGDRYVEIWNLVFMQYNRTSDGVLEKLPKPSVDTGMGLERLAAVMQGVQSNYEIDTFQQLIQAASTVIGCANQGQASLKVIADHIRSISFLMLDGVIPGNEGRGYVLRRIIRRAARHGHQLGGENTPFLYRLVDILAKEMGEAYPDLIKAQANIAQMIKREELLFAQTLAQGLGLFKTELAKLTTTEIPGDMVFKLYDTYGFPPDLTADIAREQNLTIDEAGFQTAMQAQRTRSKQRSQFTAASQVALHTDHQTQFTGYQKTQDTAEILAIFKIENAEEKPIEVKTIDDKTSGIIVLNQTPFYAESGGQVGDQGVIKQGETEFTVRDTQLSGNAYLHYGEITAGESLRLHAPVEAIVDPSRLAIKRNHTATHLLHSALRLFLGDQVMQKGSLVAADRLRFDFSYPKPLTPAQLKSIERWVNQCIYQNIPAIVTEEDFDQVKQAGDVMALFGEKYADTVRVLRIGDVSAELCGGTHVATTGEIGLFQITSETGVAAGIRRIEAVTGEAALDAIDQMSETLTTAATQLKTKPNALVEKITQLMQNQAALKKQLAQYEQQAIAAQSQGLFAQAVTVGSLQVLSLQLDQSNPQRMRTLIDQFKAQSKQAVIVLATVVNEKILLCAGVSKTCADRIHAGHLLAYVAKQIDGKAGGREHMAQGGGSNLAALPKALDSVLPWVKSHWDQ